jgi:hypothetical protein
MQLSLDPEHLRSLIAAWRAATEIKIPMAPRLKVHFMTHRGEMLSSFSITAAAWIILLRGCSAQAGDQADLEGITEDVTAFKAWADEGLQKLQHMGLQESIADDGEHMPDDPHIVASLRQMLGLRKPPDQTSS